MIRTRWTKVLLDLWSNRGRTLVVASAIAVGVFSVGVILDIQELSVHIASTASEPRFVRLWVSYQSRSGVDKTGCGISPECGYSEASPAD